MFVFVEGKLEKQQNKSLFQQIQKAFIICIFFICEDGRIICKVILSFYYNHIRDLSLP